MKTKLNNFISPLVMAATALILMSCGGGGAGDEETGGGVLPAEPDEYANTNPGLTGKLFFQKGVDDAYLIDAASGLAEYIPNTNWESQRDRFPGGTALFSSHIRQNDNTEFLVISTRCKQANSDPLSTNISCLVMQDYNGNYVGEVDVSESVYDARLSPDGNFVALYRDLDPGRNDEWLEIWSREGELISDRKDESGKLTWMNDGRLLYAFNRHFYFTKRNSTDIDYLITIPEILNNEDVGYASIVDFLPSPDNSQIAFTLFNNWQSTGINGDVLFIMNTNGTSIRKLAVSMNTDYHIIDDIAWSPDGRWIMVKEGYSSAQDHNALGTRGYLYAIPSEDMGKVFQLSTIDSERSPEVMQFRHDNNLTESGVSMTIEALGMYNLEWIP
jgi:hypothetical protein